MVLNGIRFVAAKQRVTLTTKISKRHLYNLKLCYQYFICQWQIGYIKKANG
jgi:hypothetical protein